MPRGNKQGEKFERLVFYGINTVWWRGNPVDVVGYHQGKVYFKEIGKEFNGVGWAPEEEVSLD